MKKATKPKARMYKIGDWYTSNKAGVVGQIEKITPIRPDLTRVAIRTPFNEYRLLTVKVTAQLIRCGGGWFELCNHLGSNPHPKQRGSQNSAVPSIDLIGDIKKPGHVLKLALTPEQPVDNLLIYDDTQDPPLVDIVRAKCYS